MRKNIELAIEENEQKGKSTVNKLANGKLLLYTWIHAE